MGCVILSAAKDLRLARREILRCAQDDSLWRPARFKKPTRVSRKGRPTIGGIGRLRRSMVGAGIPAPQAGCPVWGTGNAPALVRR